MADYNSLFKNAGIAGGLGSMAGGLAGLFGFGQGKNPADVANQYYSQIPGAVSPYYQPFINQGAQTGQGLGSLYQSMYENPAEFYNKLGEGYKESPGYQRALSQALGAGTNAAAAGGMAGSLQHQEQAMDTASDIASKDYQNYLNNLYGILGMGTQGGENAVNRGFQASMGYGDILGSNIAQQGQNAMLGQQIKNQQAGQNWGNVFQGAASALPWLFL